MIDALTPRRSSDAPPPDLSKERDELLANFTKASQLTRDFLRAYDQIQSQVLDLQSENARLRTTLSADDAAHELLSKIEALELEKQTLMAQVQQGEPGSYPSVSEVEAELANFANLHVACNCLHSTLSPKGVNRRIREVLEQLVGVESYVLYLCEPELTPIATAGLRDGETIEQAPAQRLLGVVQTGVSSFSDDADPSQGTMQSPAAILPLSIDDKVVGVLAIVRSLRHKQQFTTVDFELFKLLGQHAAAALMAAGLYARADRTLPGAEDFGLLG